MGTQRRGAMNPWMVQVGQGVPLAVPPPGVLRSIQPTPEQQAAALAAVRGQPAPAGTAPPRPLVNKSTKTSTPQRNSTLEGTTTLFALQSRINVLENAVEASDRQLASEKASRAAVESQLRALQTQRTEKDLEEFVLDQQPLGDDLGAQLAAAQAKCTALEQEGERLRRVSELVGAFEIRADEADLENVKLKAAAGEGERNRSELMDKLAASAARLEQKDAALDALRSEKNASESTAQEHAMEMAEDVRTAQQRSATLQEELDRAKADLDQFKSTATQRTAELKEARGKLAQQEAQMAEHRKGFIQSTNAMHNQLCATKKANDALQGRIAQLTTELDTLRGKLSAAERANATLKTSSEALNARLTQSSEEQKRLADDLATALREQSAQVEAQVATALALLGMQNQGGAAAEVGTGTGSEAAPTAAFCSVLGLPVVTSNGNQDGEKSDAPAPKRRRTCTCGRNDKVERGEPTKTGHRDGCPAKKQRLPPKPTRTTPPAREEALPKQSKFLEALRCVLAHIDNVGTSTLGTEAPDHDNFTLTDIRTYMRNSDTNHAMWKLCHDPLSTSDTAELFNPFFNPSGWKSPNWDEHCGKPLHCLPQ